MSVRYRSRLIDFRVDDKAALKMLDSLADERDRGRAVKRALTEAGKAGRSIVKPSFAKSHLPTGRTGNLRSSVKYKTFAKLDNQRAGVVVGPFGKGSQHRHLVEHGHRMVTRYGIDTGARARPNPRVAPVRRSAEERMKDVFVPALEQWVARIADK